MRRCTVCGGMNNVLPDGVCGLCYMVRLAGQMHMSYGNAMARYGQDFNRSGAGPTRPQRPVCAICGRPIRGHRTKYCSDACWQKAKYAANRIAIKKTCRGCKYLVSGSGRCSNQESSLYQMDLNKCCSRFTDKED